MVYEISMNWSMGHGWTYMLATMPNGASRAWVQIPVPLTLNMSIIIDNK